MRKWRETTPLSEFESVRAKFEKAGIRIYAYNISFKDDFSDAEIERGFEAAKALGDQHHHRVGEYQSRGAGRSRCRPPSRGGGHAQPFAVRTERVCDAGRLHARDERVTDRSR